MKLRGATALVALAVSDLTALVGLAPQAAAATGVLTDPRAQVARSGLDAALATVAGGALWCTAVWLAAGLVTASAARLPGWGGRSAATLSRALLPRAIRGLVAGGAGIGMLLAPAAALASAPSPGSAPPSPAWPVQTPGAAAPTWPATPATHRPPPLQSPPQRPPNARQVTVRPGDSLWSIAAGSLGPTASGPEIAAEWPRWFRANRAVIGDDPALIRPGTVLRAPARAPNSEEARP